MKTIRYSMMHLFAALFYVASVGILVALNNEQQITTIQVFSLHFSALPIYQLSTADILHHDKESGFFQTTVTDRQLLNLVNENLKQLPDTLTLHKNKDVRLVCLITRTSGKVDTLSFGYDGGFDHPSMMLNSFYYKLDERLFRGIIRYLPSDHQKSAAHYINTWVPGREQKRKTLPRWTSVEIISIDWDVPVQSDHSPDILRKYPGSYTTAIKDTSFIVAIQNQLKTLEKGSNKGSLHPRIVCLLQTYDLLTDTLTIGSSAIRFKEEYYNRRQSDRPIAQSPVDRFEEEYYKIDRELLLLLADKLPPEQQRQIEDFVNRQAEEDQQK